MKVRVASAGTGKTTSLVLRYLELIADGAPLRRIAGITFTRSAADELRQRVGQGLSELLHHGRYLEVQLANAQRPSFEEAKRELSGATLTTIHGFMIETLRLSAPIMGLDPNFTVLGEWEAQALFEEEFKSLIYLARHPGHALHSAIKQFANLETLMTLLFSQRSLAERFSHDEHPANRQLQEIFEAAYKKYEVRLGASLLPPSEVERRALRLLTHPLAVERLKQRYPIILVDEYQDVNPLQGRYFEALERQGLTLEVVGDPKQSIYGFRHADVSVFRRALLAGDTLPPLTHTRRHAPILTRFLNQLTATLAANDLGFSASEAPPVETKGEQEQKAGRIELHWVVGDEPIGQLREAEAAVLATQLRALHETRGYRYSDMAVLARSYAGLELVAQALDSAGLPYVLLQGRGYYERSEIRDLYHALRAGLNASGVSFAAFLRGPFAALPLAEVDAILSAPEPQSALQRRHPEVYSRLQRIDAQVRGTPLNALKFLIRNPFIAGQRYVDFLDSRARENVDALLFTVAQQPPGDIELLLERLELLSRQADAGDVPQSGEGVQLLTVHRSKGLEWPVVAVFDLGRMHYHQPQPLYIKPGTGMIDYQDSPSFETTRTLIKAREEAESYRLLYVAASRPRDVLVMTGSIKKGRPDGWAKALYLMHLGADGKPYSRDDFVLQTHSFTPMTPNSTVSQAPPQALAPYIDTIYPGLDHPPVSSPSRFKQAHFEEKLPFSDPDEGEQLPGRATTVGTLVHYAISQNWSAANPLHLENLRAQEVMFPYTPDEQQDILQEVAMLLGNYEALLGQGIPHPSARSEDYPELPMALPIGDTVWQGIIDRLYCAEGQWYLEDYKTDQEVNPAQYHFQLAVYLRAIEAVRGITPAVQLVFLRKRQIVPLEADLLKQTLAESL